MGPKVEAIVVCDAIHRDPTTGKHSLLGTFSAVSSSAFPATVAKMGLFLTLTGLRGGAPIVLRMVRLDPESDAEHVVIETPELRLPSADPLAISEVSVTLEGIQFDQPGEHRIMVFSGTEQIAEPKRLLVHAR